MGGSATVAAAVTAVSSPPSSVAPQPGAAMRLALYDRAGQLANRLHNGSLRTNERLCLLSGNIGEDQVVLHAGRHVPFESEAVEEALKELGNDSCLPLGVDLDFRSSGLFHRPFLCSW